MRIHWLQHEAFEKLGAIEPWLRERGHALSCTQLHAGEAPPPDCDGFDWLIAMGGGMNVYQHRDYPWLLPEKRLIGEAISSGRRVLGICLGAQLIADVLGGKVWQNAEREIGWFPVRAAAGGAGSAFAFPPETLVFHWHGDTFSLPPGSVWLAESDACAHQAFAFGRRTLGLQFHLEMNAAEIARLEQACADARMPGRFIQSPDLIQSLSADNGPAAALLDRLLGILERS